MIEETSPKCPHCGGVNEMMKRFVEDTPKTIAELKAWYEAHHLPPMETTRFFIGLDYRSPKAFGIYQSNGQCTLYKNYSDGKREVLYQGKDETYAVNELYLRLKQTIMNQKARMIKSK